MTLRRTHTFKHGDITIVVHCKTGGDELDAEVLDWRLRKARADRAGVDVDTLPPRTQAELYRDGTFIRAVTQTDSIEGDLGFVLPSAATSTDDLLTGFDGFMSLTGGIVKKWRQELDLIDAPPVTEAVAAANPKGDENASETTENGSTTGAASDTATSPARRAKSQS